MAKETSITGVTLFTSDEVKKSTFPKIQQVLNHFKNQFQSLLVKQDDFNLMYNHLNQMMKSNVITPLVGTKYPLSDASKAQNDVINNSGSSGRLTLIVD